MVFFIYGPETFLALAKIKELKAKFIKEIDVSGSSLINLDGSLLSWPEFYDTVAGASLFSRRRLILIEGALGNKQKDFLNELTVYLPSAAQADNILIFYESGVALDKKSQPGWWVEGAVDKPLNKDVAKIFAMLKDKAVSQYFAPLTNAEAATWLKNKFAKSALALDYKAGQLMLARLGSDLWALYNEAEKLINYAQATGIQVVSYETASALIGQAAEEKIFALTDALSNKNKAAAVALLEEQFRQGVAAPYVITMLIRQVKILINIRDGLDSGADIKTIAGQTKLHPYVLQKGVNQARNFNLAGLKLILASLVKLDYSFKSGRLTPELMLTYLLSNL